MNSLAVEYVRLALAFGQHDGAYVDAYYGPPEWREEAIATPLTIADIRDRTATLSAAVRALEVTELSSIEQQRHSLLAKRLTAMALRIEMHEGARLPFDDESRMLFDATAPHRELQDFESVLDRIAELVPGDGTLAQRVETFRGRFVIPKDRLAVVFEAAIAECRTRTLRHIELPPTESFQLEFVTDKPWSGYNWYKGNFFSLIQVNIDLPIFIGRAVDLGCHEGYPGHHTYNALLEQRLVNERGWLEFTMSPLYGPQSLISEGSANYGIELAFPDAERLAFERDVLFPLAGLDSVEAMRYQQLAQLLGELDYVGNEVARDYLNGELAADQAVELLVRYGLSSPERAQQRIRFIDEYRSYVINYNLGQDLVRDFIVNASGDEQNVRWTQFERLLSLPFAPSDLVVLKKP